MSSGECVDYGERSLSTRERESVHDLLFPDRWPNDEIRDARTAGVETLPCPCFSVRSTQKALHRCGAHDDDTADFDGFRHSAE
jgi:hypothetical protein